MDLAWWGKYGKEAREIFPGRRVSTSKGAVCAEHVPIHGGGNSGTASISLAASQGAGRIILLGYDCQKGENGETHHHGDHPKGLGNAGSMPKWPEQFRRLAQHLDGIEIINATRRTALHVWPCQPLEQALAE